MSHKQPFSILTRIQSVHPKEHMIGDDELDQLVLDIKAQPCMVTASYLHDEIHEIIQIRVIYHKHDELRA